MSDWLYRTPAAFPGKRIFRLGLAGTYGIGWRGPMMSAGDCYRFQLSSPQIDLALTGPRSGEELAANLDALERGPLSAEEERWMRDFGRAVHG